MIFLTHFPSLRMKDFLQVAMVMLVISIPGTRGHGNPVKDNISVPLKKVTLEVEPRQFDGNLGETVNSLTKDYIKGATNPTPEEVLTQLSLYRLTPIFRHCAASSTNLQAISS